MSGRVRRGSDLRTSSGPEGSSDKECSLGAVGEPARICIGMKKILLAFFIAACGRGVQLNAPTPTPAAPLVHLTADGQTYTLHSPLTSPFALVAVAGLTFNPGDVMVVDGALFDSRAALPPSPPRSLAILRAQALTVIENGAATPVRVAARTVGEALWRAGFRLARADSVTPDLATPLDGVTTITLARATSITLQADGATITRRVRAATVGAALAEVGLPLVGQDYSLPAADQPLPDAGFIQVIRIREEFLTALETLSADTAFQSLPEQDIDTSQTLQAGVNGLKQRRVRLRYENGLEVARTDEGESIVSQPTLRIIGYGTRITPRVVDTPDGPLEYWRAMPFYATAYSPARAGTPVTARWYGITASGKPLVKGLVAIDRRYIPFGTRLYVPGYGFAEAADTGGGVKGRFIDLGYDDWNYVSWHQTVMVYFLTPVPPANLITWIFPSTVP